MERSVERETKFKYNERPFLVAVSLIAVEDLSFV